MEDILVGMLSMLLVVALVPLLNYFGYGSNDRDGEEENIIARVSKKKEKKRQEREAQRLKCINRITSLEDMGRLSSVMDDRGKYICISLKEMKAVADYIKREGRVSISHLASQSNQFIDLEPKAQLVEDTSIAEDTTVA